jgi:hypothetical protein
VLREVVPGKKLYAPILRYQPPVVPNGEAQQTGVGDLLVPKETFLDGLHGIGETELHVPELVAWQFRQFRKDLQRLSHINRLGSKSRVGHNSHESRFGQRAGSPSPSSRCLEPLSDLSMVRMPRPNQGDQHVEIKQKRRH